MNRISSLLSAVLLTVVCLFASVQAAAQNSLWSYHLSYHNATRTVGVGKMVYALYNGHLLAYDSEANSSQTLDRLSHGLSENDIAYMGWSASQKCLVLLYSNNNIDLVYPDDGTGENGEFSVTNLPDVKNYDESQVDCTNLNVHNDWACVSTEKGVILLDLKNVTVKGYYQIGSGVTDGIVLNKRIYVGMNDSLMSGLLTDDLYIPSQWRTERQTLPVKSFIGSGEKAFMVNPAKTGLSGYSTGINLLSQNEDGTAKVDFVSTFAASGGSANGKYIQFYCMGALCTFLADSPNQQRWLSTSIGPNDVTRTSENTLFASQGYGGLQTFLLPSSGQVEAATDSIGNFGPRHAQSYSLLLNNGRLYVAGGFMETNFQESSLACYDGTNWNDMDEDNAINTPSRDGRGPKYFTNICHVAVDPHDEQHVVASSYSEGIYEYQDGKFKTLYNVDNSILNYPSSVVSAYHRNIYVLVGGCAYDKDGNLWMTNNGADTLLAVMRNDGTWMHVATEALASQMYAEKIMFDSKGRLWGNIRASSSSVSSGLYVLDFNNTLNDASDDRNSFHSSADNEDGTECSFSETMAMKEDRTGQIWFGCSSGVYAVTDPDDWFNTDCTVYQPKVPRNDGTNYADYLLTGTPVSAIEVDGGNRKWLGTLGAGIYLVNADGSEILGHWTKSDSPLISDNIYDLALDSITGRLYIATDNGVCCYETGTTAPLPSLNKSDIVAYPNPVRPGYTGKVTIKGLTEGAEVKVLSTGSQLVAVGNAIGGSWQWDLTQQSSGQRVAPGVYFIMVATADGKKSVATKVVVI